MTEIRENLLSFAKDTDEKLFIGQAIDMVERSVQHDYPEITHFLHPGEQELLEQIANTVGGVQIKAWGAFQQAERKRAAIIPHTCTWFNDNYEIVVLKVEANPFSGAIEHRDYLGALLGLGLKREVIGDIMVYDQDAYVAVEETISQFVLQSLQQVGRENVSVTLAAVNEICQLQPKGYQKQVITVASSRLDAVIARAFNLSRGNASSLVNQGKVKINFRLEKSSSAAIEAGDLLSCRGYGRCKIIEANGETRKGRLRLTVGFPVN